MKGKSWMLLALRVKMSALLAGGNISIARKLCLCFLIVAVTSRNPIRRDT